MHLNSLPCVVHLEGPRLWAQFCPRRARLNDNCRDAHFHDSVSIFHDGRKNNVKPSVARSLVACLAGVATAGLLSVQPCLAAAPETLVQSAASPLPLVLIASTSVLPSQRPRYLSGSNGTPESRFSKSRNGTVNPWGLGQIGPAVGIVALLPGETDRTASNQDLGARAAGATHGHPPVASFN
jgi:hypothetical protein